MEHSIVTGAVTGAQRRFTGGVVDVARQYAELDAWFGPTTVIIADKGLVLTLMNRRGEPTQALYSIEPEE